MDYQNINLGDEFVVHMPRFRGGEWSDVRKVIKVTKAQFTLEPIVPEDEQTDETPKMWGKPQRFLRSTGRRVGDSDRWTSWKAEPATAELLADIAEDRREREKAENEAAAVARAEEKTLREKYNASDISDEEVQKKYLAPLRKLAEQSEKTIAYAMKEFDGKEVTVENFGWMARRLERVVEGGEISVAMEVRDLAVEANNKLISMLKKFNSGARFAVDGKEVTTATELAKVQLQYELDRTVSRFFNFGMGNDTNRATATHKYISALREALNQSYSYSRVKEIEQEKEHA
jgi:hypothetical protein